jgi:hypothetical protein
MGPGTPLMVVLVNVIGVPGHTVVSLATKFTVGCGSTFMVML